MKLKYILLTFTEVKYKKLICIIDKPGWKGLFYAVQLQKPMLRKTKRNCIWAGLNLSSEPEADFYKNLSSL